MTRSALSDRSPAIARASARQLEGWHVLVLFIAFFGTIIGVNFVMAYSAIKTYSGLETSDAYRKGLAYNARIAASSAQDSLGWVETTTLAGETPTLAIVLVDRQGSPVTGLHVTAKIGRPATSKFDRTLVLAERGPGRYEAMLADAESGTWAVEIAAARSGRDGFETVYEARRRLWLKR